MPTAELLWTIQEDRRREAAATARERLTRLGAARPAGAVGPLFGWVPLRVRIFRNPTAGPAGWTSSR